MPSLTTTYDRIVRQPALTMPGNATGSEAACTALTGSQIRALCGLGTTDNVTFNTVTATTSVLTPLLNNTNAAALIIGNSTYGVTVPGAMGVGGAPSRGKLHIKQTASTYLDGVAIEEPGGLDSFLSVRGDNSKFIIEPTYQTTGSYQPLHFRTGGLDALVLSTSQAATFSGDISMQKATQGYIRAYGTGGVNNIAMYHDGQGRISSSTGGVYLTPADGMTGCYTPLVHSTFVVYSSDATHNISLASNGINGILSTSSGNLNLTPAGGTVAVTGAVTASGAIQETYRTSSLDPTVSDIGSGKRQGWYNTTATEFRDWVNVGGTLHKSAVYT